MSIKVKTKNEPEPPNLPSDEQLFNAKEAAAKLGMSVKTLMAHVRAGRLRFINIANGTKRKRYRFTPKNIETFIQNQKVREVPLCLFTSTPKVPFTLMTSNSAAIGFTALQKLKASGKPKPSNAN
jgi:hypothetical protein